MLAQEQGAQCCPLCCQHCVVGLWFRHCVADTVLAEFWDNTVRDTDFGGGHKHTFIDLLVQ